MPDVELCPVTVARSPLRLDTPDHYGESGPSDPVAASGGPAVRWRRIEGAWVWIEIAGPSAGPLRSSTGWVLEHDGVRWTLRALVVSRANGAWLQEYDALEQARVDLGGPRRAPVLAFRLDTRPREGEAEGASIHGRVRVDLGAPSPEPPAHRDLGAVWRELVRSGSVRPNLQSIDPELLSAGGPTALVGTGFFPGLADPLSLVRLEDYELERRTLSTFERRAVHGDGVPERMPDGLTEAGLVGTEWTPVGDRALLVRLAAHGYWAAQSRATVVLERGADGWDLGAVAVLDTGCVPPWPYRRLDRVRLTLEETDTTIALHLTARAPEQGTYRCGAMIDLATGATADDASSTLLTHWLELQDARAGD